MSVISMFPGGSGNLRIAAGKISNCSPYTEQVVSGIAFKPRFIAVSMLPGAMSTSWGGQEMTLYYVSKDGTGKIHNHGDSDPDCTKILNNTIEMTDDGFKFTLTADYAVCACWVAIR